MRIALLALMGVALAVAAASPTALSPSAPVVQAAPTDAGEVEADRLGRDARGYVTLDGALFTGTLVRHEEGATVERSAYAGGLRPVSLGWLVQLARKT